MFDLGALEQKLNTDPRLQSQFLTDPVGVLRTHGVRLTTEQEQKLRLMVGQTKMGEHIRVNLELNFIKLKDPGHYQINFTGN